MILYDFDYARPTTLEDAAALLRSSTAPAKAVAGGTDLLANMRIEISRPDLVVSLRGIEAQPPCRTADGGVRIDALSRLADLERSELIREMVPMLAASVHSVAGQQIRQMATLGGNLCQDTRCLWVNQKHDYQFREPCYKRGGSICYPFPKNRRDVCWAVYMSDTAPALMALDAQIELLGEGGTRSVPIADLFTGLGVAPHALAPGELVSAIVVPPLPARFGWGYHKSARRGGLEFAMALTAATLWLEEDGSRCAGARIALGAIREKPVRATKAEALLKGAVLDDKSIADAAAAAAEEISPLPHHGFTKSYLRDSIRVYLRRILEIAAARAKGEARQEGNANA